MPGRRVPRPACLSAVGATCEMLGKRLEGAGGDVIVLWRLARMLKLVHRDLRWHLDQLRTTRTVDVDLAETLLDDAEVHLRLVLLDQDTLRPRQIQRHVERILDTVREATFVLTAS